MARLVSLASEALACGLRAMPENRSSPKWRGRDASSDEPRAQPSLGSRARRATSHRSTTSTTAASYRILRLLLVLACLGDATLAEAAQAAQCTDSKARQDFAQRYVKFRKTEDQLYHQLTHNIKTIDPEIVRELNVKYSFDCSPLSYIFFYYNNHCIVDNLEIDESLSQQYPPNSFNDRIPDDVKLMVLNVQQVVDGWFQFHKPGSYEPESTGITAYSEENRRDWAAQQVLDTKKIGICLSTIRYLLRNQQ